MSGENDRFVFNSAHSRRIACNAGCLHLQLDFTLKPSMMTGAVAEAEAGQEGVAEAQHMFLRLLLLHCLERSFHLLLLQTHLLASLLLVMRALSTWALNSRQTQVGRCPYPAHMSLRGRLFGIASGITPLCVPAYATVTQNASSMLSSLSGT